MPLYYWVKIAGRKTKIQGSRLAAHFLPITEGEIITNWALQMTWTLLQNFQGWLLACLTRSLWQVPLRANQFCTHLEDWLGAKNYCQMTSFLTDLLCMVIELKASLSCWL